MRLCKHQKYKVIDWIKEPRYHDDHILINVASIDDNIEHYIIKFTNCSKYKDWFYMSGKKIRHYKKQKNGNGEVYAVPMDTRESFEAVTDCEHVL